MRTSFVWLFWKGQENTYRLDQDIVLPKQKCGSGVLVKWFNIFPHPHKRAIIHATTGLSLLDLLGIKRRKKKQQSRTAYCWLFLQGSIQFIDCLTKAGLLEGESCRQWPLWIRCLCTSSSADGSVQKWSAVLTLVYSKAQGPTVKQG